MKAIFIENGYGIENDCVKTTQEAFEWFCDSYEHHTGVVPSEAEIEKFVTGTPVIRMDFGLFMEWELER